MNSVDSELVKIIEMLTANEQVLIFGGLTICGALAIIFGTLASIFNRISIERSRREIAAYIAEGSITPEQGERLIASQPDKQSLSH